MNVLLINAHLNYPNWSEGTLNEAMTDVARDFFKEAGHMVMETVIEKGYDPEEEVQKHVDADLIILQTPVNWFGAPWIHKKYVDEVFNAGLHSKVLLENDGRTRSDPSRQYGTGGKMQGRKFMIAATWNAPEEAFSNPDGTLFEGRSVDDVLLNISSNYKFTGYDVLPSFGIHDIFNKPEEIKDGLENYGARLGKIASQASND